MGNTGLDAYVQQDDQFVESHLLDSYMSTFPDGSVHTKHDEKKAVKSGFITITEMSPVNMTVQLYNNDMAILTEQSIITAAIDCRLVSDHFRFTDVWVKVNNQWKAAASHVTRIEDQMANAGSV